MNEKLLMLLMSRDNWEAIESMDNWLYVFDRLPKRMRLAVDLKISGLSNKEIAVKLSITEREVYRKLLKAKKRFLQGENII